MVPWLLLVVLFCMSTQGGTNNKEGVVHCGPQNVTLSIFDPMILLTWEDGPSCSALTDPLTYELEVLRGDMRVYHDSVVVTPSMLGAPHSWSWTSRLPLNCTTDSVRLRPRYQNYTGSWEQKQTYPGRKISDRQQVYPWDQVVEVGTTVSFCCISPPGVEPRVELEKLYIEGDTSKMNTTRMSEDTLVLTVTLNEASTLSCTNVYCQAVNNALNGACVYVGYPPSIKDLQCETRDLESVNCSWKEERNTNLRRKSPTVYRLMDSECATEGSCSQKVDVFAGERRWTLLAENKLGKVALHDDADLMKRVHMFAPEKVSASHMGARKVRLEWKWKVQQYENLNLSCQVRVSDGDMNTTHENLGVGIHSAEVSGLIPNWKYNANVKCRTQHPWKWSEWSRTFSFQTRGDVPDALDVWTQVKDEKTVILWKALLVSQSHGDITDYKVTWAKSTDNGQLNETTVDPKEQYLILSLDTTAQYIVTVTAQNTNGSSSPSTIIVPSASTGRTTVNTTRINGSSGSFTLSWSSSPAASCGYTLDWCSTAHCSLDWLKMPLDQTNVRIFSDSFKGGERYTLSLYACTQGVPVLLQRREGFVSEEKIKDGLFQRLKWKQQNSDVEVSWDPISLQNQSAFIHGYVLYCLDMKERIVQNISTDDPDATSLTLRNLNIDSYVFKVKAKTAVGECGTTFMSGTLDSLTDNLIKIVSISVVAVFCLLCIIPILCYRHWSCIKQKVYPPIPKPVLTNKWLTSPAEIFELLEDHELTKTHSHDTLYRQHKIQNSCHPLALDHCQPSEVDIVDVPELFPKPEALENSYVSEDNTPAAFTQTPKGYYNQPLKNKTKPSQDILSLLGPPSSFIFPNPSYVPETGDPESCWSLDLQEGTPFVVNSDGYQPQDQMETFSIKQAETIPENPITCISTYIALPE